MNPFARRQLRAPRIRPLEGGKVFRRDALAFRLRCAPAATAQPGAFTTSALALRRREGPHA